MPILYLLLITVSLWICTVPFAHRDSQARFLKFPTASRHPKLDPLKKMRERKTQEARSRALTEKALRDTLTGF